MAAPKLKTTAVPNAPQRVLRNSGVVPTTKLKLKGTDGKVIQPKAQPAPPADPEAAARAAAEAEARAAEEAAAQAAAEEEARKAQEEYERQMEEYNRQMEEYNRQMAAIQAEEEARKAAEEEARLKAEAEARAKAEAEASVLAEIEAQLKAEADEKRRLEEEARAKEAEEARIKAEFEAKLKEEADARIIADKEAKLKAAAEARAEEEKADAAVRARFATLVSLRAKIEAATNPKEKAELDAEYKTALEAKTAAEQAAIDAHAAATKASAEALAAARAAAAITPKTPPPPAAAPKSQRSTVVSSKLVSGATSLPKPPSAKPAMKVAGLTPSTPKTSLPKSTMKVSGLTPAQPKAAEAPTAAPAPKSEVPKSSMKVPGLTPAQPKVAGLTPATPKTALPKTSLPKAAPAPAPAPAPAAEPAPAPAPAAKPKLAPKRPAGATTPTLGKPRMAGAVVLPHAAPAQSPVPAPPPAPAPDAPEDAPAPEDEVPVEEVVPELTEEELQARDERLQALQAAVSKPPFWKTPGFLAGAGFILILSIVCGYVIISHKAEQSEMKDYEASINKLLKQAEDLNKNRVDSLAQAKEKNLVGKCKCTKEDAEALLAIVVDPHMKNKKGQNILGPDSKVIAVAQNACYLLGLAAEADDEIAKMVFNTLAEECNAKSFDDKLFKFMVGRLAVADIKGINKKLKTLVKAVGSKTTIKGSNEKWRKKAKFAASLWEVIGLRVSEKDLPEIIDVLKDESCDPQVLKVMTVVLDNIFQLDTKDMARRASLGDQLFSGIPEKMRTDVGMARVLGRTGSPKALEFFKKRSQADTKNWSTDSSFYASFRGDNIIPFLVELKGKANGDAKLEKLIDRSISGIFGQNRDRTDAEVNEMITLVFGTDLDQATDKCQDLIEKTDTDGVNYERDEAKRAEYKAQLDKLRKFRNSKISFINSLSIMYDYPWVVKQLDKFSKDPDHDVAVAARNAKEKVSKNRAEEAARQAKFNSKKQAE